MANITSSPNGSGGPVSGGPALGAIHHSALRCFDAEDTRHFYEDILGLPLKAACIFEHNGLGPCEFMHLFFRMGDGDFVAFFDLVENIKPDFYSPFSQAEFGKALRVSTEAELRALAERLSAAGVKYAGPADHGFMKSIYFKDPSGINLEVVVNMPGYEDTLSREKKRAREVLAAWTAKTASRKAAFKREPFPA